MQPMILRRIREELERLERAGTGDCRAGHAPALRGGAGQAVPAGLVRHPAPGNPAGPAHGAGPLHPGGGGKPPAQPPDGPRGKGPPGGMWLIDTSGSIRYTRDSIPPLLAEERSAGGPTKEQPWNRPPPVRHRRAERYQNPEPQEPVRRVPAEELQPCAPARAPRPGAGVAARARRCARGPLPPGRAPGRSGSPVPGPPDREPQGQAASPASPPAQPWASQAPGPQFTQQPLEEPPETMDRHRLPPKPRKPGKRKLPNRMPLWLTVTLCVLVRGHRRIDRGGEHDAGVHHPAGAGARRGPAAGH